MRVYSVSEIEAATYALATVKDLVVDSRSEDWNVVQSAKRSAIHIIATGLAEIEAEHSRANEAKK